MILLFAHWLVGYLCPDGPAGTVDKYRMTVYPSVWPLPYGVTVRTDLSPDHNYAIPRSQTQCWPMTMGDYQQVTINAMHNGWIGNQAWVLRGWLSADPAGSNVLPAAYGARRNVHLSYHGNSWNFYVAGLPADQLASADTSYPIDPSLTYYFCIQNTANEDDSYYLRFTYQGAGATLVA